MFTRILIASATLVALAAPAAQASPLHKLWQLFPDCHFAAQTQCAVNKTKGSHNKARIDQDQDWWGIQLALQFQHGNGNDAYTGQVGTNQVAATFQKGDDNTAYTAQQGYNQAAIVVQTGNGGWTASSNNASNSATYAFQSN